MYLGTTSPLYKAATKEVISKDLKSSLWLSKDKNFHMQAMLWRLYPWNIIFGRRAHNYRSRLFAITFVMHTAVLQRSKSI